MIILFRVVNDVNVQKLLVGIVYS